MDIDAINKQLSRGVLPDCLNFTLEPKPMDISQIKYNAFYRSYEYVENKFPKGYENIPGFDKVIQSIADKLEEQQITPLSEMLKRQKGETNLLCLINDEPDKLRAGWPSEPDK